MNTTRDKSFDLSAPSKATDLGAKTAINAGQVLKVGPRTTTVLYLGEAQ